MKCPICGFENQSGMKFCGQCGTQLGIACLSCGFVNPLDYRFCGMCGSRLERRADSGHITSTPAST